MKRAFTLLETVLASALLCAVMLLLFNLYPATAMAIRHSQDQVIADSIAESIFAEARETAFQKLDSLKGKRPAIRHNGNSFYPEIEIFPVGIDPTVLTGVRVTITWQSFRGPKKGLRELVLANLQR